MKARARICPGLIAELGCGLHKNGLIPSLIFPTIVPLYYCEMFCK